MDSGATHHFHKIGSMNLPQQPTYNYNTVAQLFIPNGQSMVSSKTTHLPTISLPSSDKKSHSFNRLESESLFYVGKYCDHNCTVVFDKNSVKTFNSTEVNINTICPLIIRGHHNAPSKPLYLVYLPTHPPPIHRENATINVS